jgi:hypothetical protein
MVSAEKCPQTRIWKGLWHWPYRNLGDRPSRLRNIEDRRGRVLTMFIKCEDKCDCIFAYIFLSWETIPRSIFVRCQRYAHFSSEFSQYYESKMFYWMIFLNLPCYIYYLVKHWESANEYTFKNLLSWCLLFPCTTRLIIWHYSTVIGDKCQHAMICTCSLPDWAHGG